MKKKTKARAKKKTKKRVGIRSRARVSESDPSEWDENATVEVNPEPRIRSGLSTSIRLPVAMVNQLRKIAAKKGDFAWIVTELAHEIGRGTAVLAGDAGALDLCTVEDSSNGPDIVRHGRRGADGAWTWRVVSDAKRDGTWNCAGNFVRAGDRLKLFAFHEASDSASGQAELTFGAATDTWTSALHQPSVRVFGKAATFFDSLASAKVLADGRVALLSKLAYGYALSVEKTGGGWVHYKVGGSRAPSSRPASSF